MDAHECQKETALALSLSLNDVTYITADLLGEYEKSATFPDMADGNAQGEKGLREEGGLRNKWGTYGNTLVFTPDEKRIFWRQGPKGGEDFGAGTAELRQADRQLVTHVTYKGTTPEGVRWYFIGNYAEPAPAAGAETPGYLRMLAKPFADQSGFSRMLITLITLSVISLLGFFLYKVFNQDKGLAEPGFVRGWITLLICFATIAFGVGIVNAALRLPKKDDGFRYSREVFGSFTAVLATIVGFYFGSETRNADPTGAAVKMVSAADQSAADTKAATAADAEVVKMEAAEAAAARDADALGVKLAELRKAAGEPPAADKQPEIDEVTKQKTAAEEKLALARKASEGARTTAILKKAKAVESEAAAKAAREILEGKKS